MRLTSQTAHCKHIHFHNKLELPIPTFSSWESHIINIIVPAISIRATKRHQRVDIRLITGIPPSTLPASCQAIDGTLKFWPVTGFELLIGDRVAKAVDTIGINVKGNLDLRNNTTRCRWDTREFELAKHIVVPGGHMLTPILLDKCSWLVIGVYWDSLRLLAGMAVEHSHDTTSCLNPEPQENHGWDFFRWLKKQCIYQQHCMDLQCNLATYKLKNFVSLPTVRKHTKSQDESLVIFFWCRCLMRC